MAQTNVRLGRCFVNAASHILNDVTMIGIDQSKTTISYALLLKSFTEHFIRVWIHTSKISKVSRNISYVYEFIRRRFHTRIKSNAFEKIRVCKIPWMILHNDTRIKSYTYEKLHVWTVTRMKNYTYEKIEKLHVLDIEFWLVHCYTRIDSFTELLIRVCF